MLYHQPSWIIKSFTLLFWIMLVSSCEKEKPSETASTKVTESIQALKDQGSPPYFENKQVFWGDTHFHTAISGDAFGGGTRLSPEESYRLAIGERITSNTGQGVQLIRPLDWLAISDHAEGFGSFLRS